MNKTIRRVHIFKKPYTGVLLKPLETIPIPEITPENLIAMVEYCNFLGIKIDKFNLEKRLNREIWDGRLEIAIRLKALLDHYDIVSSEEGAIKDLLHALACRHEGLASKSQKGVSYSSIFKKYNVPVSDTNSDLLLVYSIARNHIKGFKRSRSRHLSKIISDKEMHILIWCISEAFTYLIDTLKVKEPKPIQVIRVLLDEEIMRNLLKGSDFQALKDVFREMAYSSRDEGNRDVPSERTLLTYYKDWLHAVKSVTPQSYSPRFHQVLRITTNIKKMIHENELKKPNT